LDQIGLAWLGLQLETARRLGRGSGLVSHRCLAQGGLTIYDQASASYHYYSEQIERNPHEKSSYTERFTSD
jgi:hypothetical protein